MKIWLIAAMASAMVASPAMATITTYQQSFDSDPAGYPYFNQYDGPLKIVGVSVDYGLFFGVSGLNSGDQPETIELSASGFAWFSANGSYSSYLPSITSDTATAVCDPYSFCGISVGASGHADMSSDNFFLFAGSGQVLATSFVNYDGDLPDTLVGPEPISADIGGTITYYLSDVPEPAAWGMMLVGFGAIGAGMRRRRTTVRFA